MSIQDDLLRMNIKFHFALIGFNLKSQLNV